MKAIARKFRIKRLRTTVFHPQSNGSIERSHHVLTEYLKQYVRNYDNWDEWVDLAMFPYNTSVHEGTRYTPYELIFGKLARLPSDYEIIEELNDRTYEDYLIELYTKIRATQNQTRVNLIRAKEKSKEYYDRWIKILNLRVGDLVFLLKEPQKGKFGDQYTGPHQVVGIKDNHNVTIKIGNRLRVVHKT